MWLYRTPWPVMASNGNSFMKIKNLTAFFGLFVLINSLKTLFTYCNHQIKSKQSLSCSTRLIFFFLIPNTALHRCVLPISFPVDLLLSKLWNQVPSSDWAYEFPDRIGPDTQICWTGPARPDWIQTSIFKHFTYDVGVINSHKIKSLDTNLVSKNFLKKKKFGNFFDFWFFFK